MKKLLILSAMLFCGAANAADITVFFSPTCPHCHHAREFISNTLVYEFPTVKVTEINVMESENREMFMDALKKCEYTSGGVPVLVIGEKCFQGYADFMQDDLRAAVSVDLNDEQKQEADQNKQAMQENPEQFRAENAQRADAVAEYNAATANDKKDSSVWFYVLLIALVAGLGLVLVKKDKNKK